MPVMRYKFIVWRVSPLHVNQESRVLVSNIFLRSYVSYNASDSNFCLCFFNYVFQWRSEDVNSFR